MNIGLSIELMLLVFFSFILCIFLLNQWLYKPILSLMDSREKMMDDDLRTTDSNYEEIRNIDEQVSNILNEAKNKAAMIREQAYSKAKAAYDKKIEETKMNNEKELIMFMEMMNNEKEELKNALLLEIPNLRDRLHAKLNS